MFKFERITELLNVDVPHLFVMFIIFAFLGWMCEEVYCCSIEKKWVYRGMLFGPICPIYGFGGVLIAYALFPLRETWIPLFIASFVLTSVVEYFGSWVLEKVFHMKWWDYSHYKFNINGRVCLLNSSLFGLMGVVAWHFVIPLIYKIIYFEPVQPYFLIIYYVLKVAITVDLFFTVRHLVNLSTVLAKMKIQHEVHKEEFRKKLEERKAKIVEHWLSRYPKLKSKEYDEMIKKVKEFKNHIKNNKKN